MILKLLATSVVIVDIAIATMATKIMTTKEPMITKLMDFS